MDEPTIKAGDCQKVGQALRMLGAAYRSDWMDFDGRTLRSQLDELARFLTGDEQGFDLEGWAYGVGVCPVNGGWQENCPTKSSSGMYECDHLVEYYNKKETVND